MPARVLLQDFTGVPAVVDLATMREAVQRMGGNPKRINPLFPAELVIDHSVQVDSFGSMQRFRSQCGIGISAQRGALRISALGPDGISQFQSGAARHRHLPPGESRISGARGLRAVPAETKCRLIPIPWSAPTRTPP